jgi:hypothetical protein
MTLNNAETSDSSYPSHQLPSHRSLVKQILSPVRVRGCFTKTPPSPARSKRLATVQSGPAPDSFHTK